jgi:UDP-N-acetylglucosamine 3-dehydrogenase
MKKTKVAVIGVGNMGKNHVRTYSDMSSVELVAIADPSEESRKIAASHGCRHYADYKTMLAKEEPDAVSVCVPTGLHYAVAKDVISSGVSLLVEKPITRNVAEAEEIIRMAKEKGVRLAVGHIERFNPAVRRLREIIGQGRLGEVMSITARRVGLFPPQIRDANVVIDLAVHDMDVFNFLLGRKPDRVLCESGRAIAEGREDFADIFMKYGNANGFIQVNWITPVKIRQLNVTGTKGYAELNYITQELVLYESNYEKKYADFGEFVLKFGEPKKTVVDVQKGEPLRKELEHFISCVQNNRQPEVDGEAGLDVLRIALEAERFHNNSQHKAGVKLELKRD